MAGQRSANDDVDDPWEYEYDPYETESFLVDVDLTSLNDNAKARLSKLQKSTRDAANNKSKARASVLQTSAGKNIGGDVESTAREPLEPTTPPDEHESGDRIQILDLNSHNPIIAYQNQIYSCSWIDMIGTGMFFTQHEENSVLDPALSLPEFDLLGLSRIKLAGRRAKLAETTQSRKRRRGELDGEDANHMSEARGNPARITDGRSFGALRTPNPKVNIEVKQQAQFLESLMALKHKRGERDTVRTFVNQQIVAVDAKKKTDNSPALRTEIDELNRKVVQGDAAALARLQEIYSQLDDDEDNDAAGESDIELNAS